MKARFQAKHGLETAWDWEAESAKGQAIKGLISESMGEEIVKEINCTGSADDVFIRIRTELDPFFLLCDVAEDNRATEGDVEVDEENYDATKWLPKCDFGHYCPVTYIKHGWLNKGDK